MIVIVQLSIMIHFHFGRIQSMKLDDSSYKFPRHSMLSYRIIVHSPICVQPREPFSLLVLFLPYTIGYMARRAI